jgi:DNA-binding response OmpR family regulator
MKPSTILVVDDEFYTAEILTFVLESQGYRVLGAFNGRDGLEKLKLSAVDLIILDVMMPIMDGAEMARALDEDHTLATIPRLVTSALSEATVRGMFAHIDGFLRKPFLMETVTSQVRALLRARRTGDEGVGIGAREGTVRHRDSG